MRIALAQVNPIVGDIPGNVARATEILARARAAGAELVVFGELSLCGYPPRDLVRKEQFVADNQRAAEKLARECQGIAALVGFVRPTPGSAGRPLQNVAALLVDGQIGHVHVKTLLPTYDVFDETRYFEPGERPACIEIAGHRVGLSICEDLWDSVALGRALYGEDPIDLLVRDGAEIIINMAASPYHLGKAALREELFSRRAREHALPIAYVNQVGGNDELVFDGGSCLVSSKGEVVTRAKGFEEDLLITDTDAGEGRLEPRYEDMDGLSHALKLGLGDYIRKCGFHSVVLGLSGGIDSAVVAVLAADAVGPENVCALAMPSRYSSDHSLTDAEDLARNLGIDYRVLPIETVHQAFDGVLAGPLAGGNHEIADENIQARIRGNLVMAFSNAFGHLPLATGNKSELSVGYCTLYGDMCGGLAPIGDVLKTTVFELARHLNVEVGRERIPENILTKPPSAELKPDQFDQDKLPPYDLLDEILRRYIEDDLAVGEIVSAGFDPAVVRRVIGMVDASEYKRKQAAQVLKVSPRAFGQGRRMPIAQRYVSGTHDE
jgi:NAD+ synthase (glutamine-hydrolysing)